MRKLGYVYHRGAASLRTQRSNTVGLIVPDVTNPFFAEMTVGIEDRLDQADYLVGFFYWRQRWFPGAIDRFKDVIKQDPAFTNRDAVYFYLAEAYLKLNRTKEALPLLDRLIEEFETSEYLEQAKKLSETLKADEKKAKNGSGLHDS